MTDWILILELFQFIWRRLEEPTYLTFNYRRISLDKRYHVVMADLNEFKMDLKIENVTLSDEGEYICLYRSAKLVHEKHVYLKVLGKLPISAKSNASTPFSAFFHKSRWIVEHQSGSS